MARVFIDGFESGEHDMWDAEGNATVASSVGKDMDGDYCLDIANTSEYLSKTVTGAAEMYFAFLYRHISASYGKQVLGLYNGSNTALNVNCLITSGLVTVRRGTTLLDTGSKVLAANTTYLIEVYAKIADSGGRFVVKVDGETDIDFTGDTLESTYTQFDNVRLGYHGASYFGAAYFDNFIMDNSAWIGDTKIQAIVPTGAGNSTNWTPSAGNNYACVDEIPPSDADYVSTNSNDVVDTYAAGNLAGDVQSVKCVQIQSRARTDGAPTPKNLKLVARVNGTDYLSGDNAVSVAEKGLYNLWELNPDDSASWEVSDVNAMEIGKRSAA